MIATTMNNQGRNRSEMEVNNENGGDTARKSQQYYCFRRNYCSSSRLLVLVAVVLVTCCLGVVTAFSTTRTVPTRTASSFVRRTGTGAPRFDVTSSSTALSATSKDNDEVNRLLNQAAKLRAEIAAMEGKSLQEVEQEASDKKLKEKQRLEQEKLNRLKKQAEQPKQTEDGGRYLQVPMTSDDMIRQAARAIERAYKDGLVRQTVRLALIKEDTDITTDEEWPGGPQQMYREAAKPLTRELLRQVRIEDNVSPLPPVITDEDVWDFDGSGVVTAQSKDSDTIRAQALVFANTDTKYLKDIDTMHKFLGDDKLFLLVNPYWSNVDSWGFNILAPNAKQQAQEIVFDVDYKETYVLQKRVARGEDCVALKVYPHSQWQLYCFLEDKYTRTQIPIRLGSTDHEPTSSDFADWINERPEFKLSKNMRQMKDNNMF